MNIRSWLPLLSTDVDEETTAPSESREPATGLTPIPSDIIIAVADQWPAEFSQDALEENLNAVQDYAVRAYGPVAYPGEAPSNEVSADHPIAELVRHPERTSDLERLFHSDDADGIKGYIIIGERWDVIKDDLSMSQIALEAVQEAHRVYAIELGCPGVGELTNPLLISTNNPPAIEGDVADPPADDTDAAADAGAGNAPVDESETVTHSEPPSDSPETTDPSTETAPPDPEADTNVDQQRESQPAADGDRREPGDRSERNETAVTQQSPTTKSDEESTPSSPAAASSFVFGTETEEDSTHSTNGQEHGVETADTAITESTEDADDTPAHGQDSASDQPVAESGGPQGTQTAPETDPLERSTFDLDVRTGDEATPSSPSADPVEEATSHSDATEQEWDEWMLAAVEPRYEPEQRQASHR